MLLDVGAVLTPMLLDVGVSQSLVCCCMDVGAALTPGMLLDAGVSLKHIPLIIENLASFRLGLHQTVNITKADDTTKTYLKVPFHNKGIEVVNWSQIVAT